MKQEKIFNDDYKAGFETGQTDRSAAIARSLLCQGWSVEFVAKTVMLDKEVIDTIKRLMEEEG